MDNRLSEAIERIVNFMKEEYKGEDIRFCSTLLFGDSKFIERNKPLAETFNSLAIVERPNIIYLRTDTDIVINGINLKELTEKLHLAAFFGGDIESIEQKHKEITVVISENLSFFMSEQPNNAVFLYNKGFHLTKQISHFARRLKFNRIVFFGDLDCRGIEIFNTFKTFFEEIEFYPDRETARFVVENFSLPALKETCKNMNITHLKDMADMIEERNVRIEQEFLQVLFAKGGVKKPSWIK